MATAAPTRKKAPAHKRKPTGPPAKGQSPTDLLQGALDDLTAARERASDDIRRELGLVAVKAQTSPEALKAMAAEIRKRKAEIAPTK